MIIDCHVHFGKSNWFHMEAGVDDLLHAADRAGIDRMMVTDMASLFYDMKEGNKTFRRAIEHHRDRIIPYYTVSSARFGQWAVDQLEHYVNDYGFRGMKIYSVPPLYVMTDGYMVPIVQKAAELKIPILAHANPADCIWMARQVPDALLIMAHMGCCPQASGDWHAAVAVAKEFPNIYLDTASSSFDNGMIEFAVEQAGAEKVLYGSDTPLLNTFLQIAKVTESRITDAQKELILQGNIERLLRRRGEA